MPFRLAFIALAFSAFAADYSAPAGTRPAIRRPGAPSIVPGGRVIAPTGRQYITGPGPFGLGISADGKTVVSVNSGPERFSLTVLEQDKKGQVTTRHFVAAKPRDEKEEADETDAEQWRSGFMGVGLSGNRAAYVSEGNSGRVRLIDLSTGSRRQLYHL